MGCHQPDLAPALVTGELNYLLDDDVARLSAHTAFDDPTTAADAPPRRSIELRALVFFDD